MTWVRIDPLRPLSTAWTIERIIGTLRAMLAEKDAESISNFELRVFLNVCLPRVAAIVRKTNPTAYGIAWQATFTRVTNSNYWYHDLAVPYGQGNPDTLNLETNFAPPPGLPVGQFIPYNQLHSIESISFRNQLSNGQDLWIGQAKQVPVGSIMSIASNENGIYRQSVLWAQQGNHLYGYYGPEIQNTASTTLGDGYSYTMPFLAEIWGQRRPSLDNLGPEAAPPEISSWQTLLDLPDEYVQLLLLHMKQTTNEAIQKQPDQVTAALIAQQEAEITGQPNGQAPAGQSQ